MQKFHEGSDRHVFLVVCREIRCLFADPSVDLGVFVYIWKIFSAKVNMLL